MKLTANDYYSISEQITEATEALNIARMAKRFSLNIH